MQMLAAHMQHGIGIQVAITLPEPGKGDFPGMAEQPGGLVIE